MAPPPTRARSSTSGSTASNRPRPISRASTTSLNTPGAQPVQPYPFVSEAAQLAPRQQDHPQPENQNPEQIFPKSEQQLKNQSREYVIDPSLQNPTAGTRAMGTGHMYSTHRVGLPTVMDDQHSFEAKQSPFPVNFNDEQIQSDAGVGEIRKKKGSASSIANDQELRKLFRENYHRDLKEVAAEVLVHERGPKSEKTKQIFAMNW